MRNIPDPGFAGDDGAADPAVETALRAYAADPDRLHTATLAVLQHGRVLVPVIATPGDAEHHEPGPTRERSSDMATVLMRGRDGRTALLAFTSMDTLRLWDPEARPVPVTAAQAAEAARQDEASAMVLDVAGPVMFVVDGEDLTSLADGYTLVRLGGRHGWAKVTR